jgi:hypothetical protein
LHSHYLVLFFAPKEIPRLTPLSLKLTEMLSLYGTVMQRKQRDPNRDALGCPSILGSWSLLIAKLNRDFGTEPNR